MKKTLKILALVGKVAGVVAAMGEIPGVDPKWGLLIFAAASIVKDAVNRIGDVLDDGQSNNSFSALLVAAAVPAVLIASGCASFDRNAYRVLGTMEATVDKAMIGWADYVVWRQCQSGPLEDLPQQEARVKEAYTAYRQAANAAYAARSRYILDRQNGKPEWEAALRAASEAMGALVGIIEPLVAPNQKAITDFKAKQQR